MAMELTFDAAREGGFILPNAREWMTPSDNALMSRLAQDAALITTPNSTVPAELLAYYDTQIIEILTTPRNARKIFEEAKKGDWTTPYAKFRVQEYTGRTTVYSDYADGGAANVNFNWPSRAQYVFQTVIKYGARELDIASRAKLNLAAEKQKAAARAIDIDANKFYLYGVQGKEIYGLLNDPNLNPSITPGTSVSGSSTKWADKTADEIYEDVRKLRGELSQNSQGNINEDTALVLVLPPQSNMQLGKINTYGLSVRQMLKNEFGGNLTIVELPELYSATAGNTIMLIAKDILGIATAQLGFGEKYRAHPLIQKTSSFEQKVSATTYGCIIYYPFAIATMEGL